MKQTLCSRCIVPASYPGTDFDLDGICNHCRDYTKSEPLGVNALLAKINSKESGDYDCLIGISGGKDSCYAAYAAARDLGLRVLALCYDFPFLRDLARQNAETVCTELNIPLLVVQSKGSVEYSILRNHLMSVAATGTTWGQCLFCHYGIDALLYATALERNIPFILSGTISSETWWQPGNRTAILMRHIKRLPLADLLRFTFHQASAYCGLVKQRKQFSIPDASVLNVYKRARIPSHGPEFIPLFDYIRWDQAAIEETLIAEAGWQRPEDSLTWRYDCILEPLLDYTYKREFGISSAGLYLSDLVRAGQITREEALSLQGAREDDGKLRDDIEYVFDFLKIPQAYKKKILS